MTPETALTPPVVEALKQGFFAALHVAMPGIVRAFDPETKTASVQPACAARSGAEVIPLPLLQDVPVFWPAFTDASLAPVVSAGDFCLLVFADTCIDGWYTAGEAAVPPSARRHDLSDAFAFVGFRCAKGVTA